MRHRDHVVADLSGVRGGEGDPKVQADLVAEEIEIDPGFRDRPSRQPSTPP
jgi:hypothetical protein